jgi:hypothetical protein
MGSLRDLSLQPVEDYSSLRGASLASGMTPEQAAATAASVADPFSAGAKSAIRGTLGGMKGLAAGVVDAYGGKPDDLYAAAQHDAELAQVIGPRVNRLRDIGSASDAAGWALGTVGQAAPFLAMGIGGGLAGRGINTATRAGLSADAAAQLGATAAYVPSMAGDQITQMKQYAPDMPADERLLRGLGVGGLQAATEALVPTVMLRTPGMAQPFWKGLGTQVATEAGSEAASDVIGQAHRMDFQPGYEYDPMQTLDAAAAGAVGTAPYAVPGAVAGQMANSGISVTDKARGMLGGGVDAAGNGLDGLKAAGRQALDGVQWAGQQVYEAAPEPLRKVFDYLGKGGQMTAEMAEAISPYASALGEIGKGSLKAYYDGLKEAAGEAKDAYTAGANPLTGLGTRLYGETVKGMGDAYEAIGLTAKALAADTSIPEPIRKAVGGAKSVDDVLTAFGDPKSWLSEGEKMDANKLRAIDAAMKRPLQSAQFVDSLMSYLDEVGADGPAAQEVRAQAERLRNGEQLGEREARNFWMSAQLARKAAGDKQALDAVLNIGKKVKITQKGKQVEVENLSRQRDTINLAVREALKKANADQGLIDRIASRIQTGDVAAGKNLTKVVRDAVTEGMRSFGINPEASVAFTRLYDGVLKAVQGRVDELKAEGVISEDAGQERPSVSEAFRKTAGDEIRNLFQSTERGKELAPTEEAVTERADQMVDFITNLAHGEEGYTDGAAAKVRAMFEAVFGDEGGSTFDRIVDAAQHEFGGLGDSRAENIAALLDTTKTLHQAGAAARKLLTAKDARLTDLLSDIETAKEFDAKRGDYDTKVQKLERKAMAAPFGSNERYEGNAQVARMREVGSKTGFEHLKEDWVERGIVTAKNYEKLVQALESYGRHPDRLTKPERREASHSTSANHAAEREMQEEGRAENPISHEEVENKVRTDSGDDYQQFLAERRKESIGADTDVEIPAIFWGTNTRNPGAHNQNDMGAPVSRHPSGDAAQSWNAQASEYTNAMEEASAKYGHRVTDTYGVTVPDWAAELEKRTDVAAGRWMNTAMTELLKHDQERLKNDKLTERDKKWIENRAALAKRLGEDGGEAFFAHPMNRHYRYIRMEQGDAANLKYSAEQLQHGGYTLRGEGETMEDVGAWVERQQKKDGDVFKKKVDNEWVSDLTVYTDSLLPVHKADGTVMQVDIPKLISDAIRRHQAGDITGTGEQGKTDLSQEIMTAFHNVIAAIMTGNGMSNDPFGAVSGRDSRILVNVDPTSNRGPTNRKGESTAGEQGMTFDPELVVFRDPTGRVIQELGEHVSVNSPKRVFRLKDLMNVKGVDADLRTIRESGTPGIFSDGDLKNIVLEQKGKGARRYTEAEVKKDGLGIAVGGIDGKNVDLHAGLARMVERNGMDANEALRQGNMPKQLAGVLLREMFTELRAQGYDGPLLTTHEAGVYVVPEKFNDVVVYHQQYGDNTAAITLGELRPFIVKGDSPRNMRDALIQEAMEKLQRLEKAERAPLKNIRDGRATTEDKSHLARKEKTDEVEKQMRATKFDRGDPETGVYHRKNEDGISVYDDAAEANNYDPADVENMRLRSVLKELGEMSGGDTPLHDRSQTIKDESAWGNKAYGESTAGEKPKRAGELQEPKAELSGEQLAAQRARREEALKHDPIAALREKMDEMGVGHLFDMAAMDGDKWSKEFQKYLDSKSVEKREPSEPQSVSEVDNAPLNKPSTPYEQPRIPAKLKYEAKMTSTDVRTNAKELEDRAFREESRAISKRVRPKVEAEEAARLAAEEADRLTKAEATEAEASTPAAKEETPGRDMKPVVDEWNSRPAKSPAETFKLVDTLNDAELREFMLGLKPKKGTVAEQAFNRLSADSEWGAKQRERAGVEMTDTGFYDPENPFSRQRTTENASAQPDAELLQKAKEHFFGDAFGFELQSDIKAKVKDANGNEVEVSVSGKFDKKGMKAIVSAMASDRFGTLAHEGWHGVETLLGDMGSHGERILSDIYEHVSSKEVQDWLRERFADDKGVLDQLGSEKERAAFAFQLIAKGEKIPPLNADSRTTLQKVVDFVRGAAAKLGIEFTTTKERAENFLDYMKEGGFARDFENAPELRRALGEKNGDAAIHDISKALKPLAEGFEKIVGHSSERIRKLDIPEYTQLMEMLTGQTGKGGYNLDRDRATMRFANKIGQAIDKMSDAEIKAWFDDAKGGYSNIVTEVDNYVREALREGGVEEHKIASIVRNMFERVDTFNAELIADNMEGFITDLVKHGGLKGKAGEARQIANDIADNGYYFDPERKLFDGKPEIAAKWAERDPLESASRFISVATKMAERTRWFGYKDEKLAALKKAGDLKADKEGQQLMQDFIDSVDGKLGGTMTPDMKKLQGGLLFVQNLHALPLAVFSQMLEPLQLALRKNAMAGSLDALFRGVKDMPRTFKAINKKVNPDYWEKFAYQVGSAPHRIVNDVMSRLMNGMHLGGTVGKLNEKFFRYNFMEQWNRSMHVEATKHAVEFLKEAARGQHGDHSERFLRDLGVTEEEILKAIRTENHEGQTYETLALTDNIERAIVQYVDEAMAHPDTGSNAMWMNDPRFAMLAQMKRFTFSHSKYVLDRGISEYKLGNAFPLAPAVIAMPWMLAADGLRDTLTLAENNQRANWGVWDYAKHSFERAGHAGRGQFFNDAMNAAGRGSSPVEALGGPTIEMFGNFARGAHNGKLIDAMIDYTPITALPNI